MLNKINRGDRSCRANGHCACVEFGDDLVVNLPIQHRHCRLLHDPTLVALRSINVEPIPNKVVPFIQGT
jgi:hypothetical protein